VTDVAVTCVQLMQPGTNQSFARAYISLESTLQYSLSLAPDFPIGNFGKMALQERFCVCFSTPRVPQRT
jgi:hypothetical protein